MNMPAPIRVVSEDELGAAVVIKLNEQTRRPRTIERTIITNGFGALDKNIAGYNNASRVIPHIVIRDLDRIDCPPVLLDRIRPASPNPGFLLRIAVREVEAWLLADRKGIAEFFGIPRQVSRIPYDVDTIPDPKSFLISLARRSRLRDILNDIVPLPGSRSIMGRGYNGRLIHFVRSRWNIAAASENSPSLQKAVTRINDFSPDTP